MGALIVVLGGIVGLFGAGVAWLSGASLFWILVTFAAAGHGVTAILLLRHYGQDDDLDLMLQHRIETEMVALREHQAALARAHGAKTADPVSVFGMLRRRGPAPRY